MVKMIEQFILIALDNKFQMESIATKIGEKGQ